MKTRFVLIDASHAGNVGAVARAMKVMGFDDLVLLRPRWANVLRREETIQRASGALDVLEKCRVVDQFEDAVAGCEHLFATAMTPRDFGPPTLEPRDAFSPWMIGHLLSNIEQTNAVDIGQMGKNTVFSALEAAGAVQPAQSVAFLFGPERYGMSNDDVYRCHTCLTIPANPAFGSLNLAAAAQVIAYEWRQALGGFAAPAVARSESDKRPNLADAAMVQGALKHWAQAMVSVGFLDPAEPKKLLPRLNQVLNRAQLREEEVHILRGMAKAILAQARQIP